MTTYYLIRNATNDLWYNEDHSVEESKRWTPNMSEAYRFASKADAQTEIDGYDYTVNDFFIIELTSKI